MLRVNFGNAAADGAFAKASQHLIPRPQLRNRLNKISFFIENQSISTLKHGEWRKRAQPRRGEVKLRRRTREESSRLPHQASFRDGRSLLRFAQIPYCIASLQSHRNLLQSPLIAVDT
jgi:hypothetical protein